MEIDFGSLVEATSGAVGAIVSTSVLYPLDTCKSKYQAEVRVGSTRKYSYFKRLYLRKARTKSIGTKANLVIAAAAGACTSIIIQPLDTASSRMQTSEFGESKGLWETLSQRSWGEAFDGLGISLLLTSNPAIQYTVFDQLKQRLLKHQKSNRTDLTREAPSPQALSAFSAFLLGALSKCIATFCTYPAIRCKATIQAPEPKEETKDGAKPKSKTIIGATYTIWRKEGPLGFYKGLQAQILKTVLSSALLLMIKEKISRTTWVLMLALRMYIFGAKKRVKNI